MNLDTFFFCEHSQKLVKESQSLCSIFHQAYYCFIRTESTAKTFSVWKKPFHSSFVMERTVVTVNGSCKLTVKTPTYCRLFCIHVKRLCLKQVNMFQLIRDFGLSVKIRKSVY